MSFEKFNKHRKEEAKSSFKCLECGKEHFRPKWRIVSFCDEICSSLNRRKERIREWIEDGKDWKINIPGWVKYYLISTRGNNCEICKIVEWNNKSIIFEVDHIDGNPSNNISSNLRLICPNCHSQTPTYKNKNKGNGRQSRRKKL